MLDEITTVLTPTRKSKMLAAEPGITELLPLVESKISFVPLINYLKEKRQSVSDTRERLYNDLIKKFESEPSLLHAENVETIYQHSELMELLTTSLFPVVANDQRRIFALATPYRFNVFYYSDFFREIFFDEDEKHLLLPNGMPIEE